MNAGTVQLASIVLSLGGMHLLDPVMLDTTAQLARQVQGRFPATLVPTALETTKNQSCVPLEHTSPTAPEQVEMTVSTVQQVRICKTSLSKVANNNNNNNVLFPFSLDKVAKIPATF